MILERLDTTLKDRYATSAWDLAWARILFSSYLLFFYLPRGLFVIEVPGLLLGPSPGLTRVAAEFPAEVLLPATNLVASVLAGLLLFGIKVGPVAVLLTVVLLILNSIVYATGKIEHDVLLVFMPLLFHRAWSATVPSNDDRRPCWALGFQALLVGLMFLTAGLPKLFAGWLYLDSQAVLAFSISYACDEGRIGDFLEWALALTPRPLWELQDWITVLFELALLPAVLIPSLFRRLLLVSVAFHFGVMLQMDLAWPYQLPVYASFAPWGSIFGRPPAWFMTQNTGRPRPRWLAVGVTLAAFLLCSFGLWRSSPLLTIGPTFTASRLAIVIGFILAAMVAIVASIRSARREGRPEQCRTARR